MNNDQEASKKKPFYKKWWVWVIAIFVLFIIIGESGDSDTPIKSTVVEDTLVLTEENIPVVKKEEPQQKFIEYSVLREWNPDNDSSAIGLEILISPQDVSKDKITALAQSIGSQSDKVNVKVYQTQEAWDAEKNETYGDVFNEGYIAFYVKNKTNSGAYRGSNEVRWLQEIGELKDLFGSVTQINN